MNTATRGQHRTESAPWWVRLTCKMLGHQVERINARYVRCGRCERIATHPVRLP